ncbi:hypothetical protein [Escherichia coli]|uniref:hypothetical protein n=1 Tax=Escherichia coli TaxID=562 RepID=UPI0015DC9967|nr:hypothetical protein [Escherichia coli]BBT77064.1 hypothetical protein WP8S18E07_35040 [Escherichia coli]
MLGGADNPNGELLSYIIGADSILPAEFSLTLYFIAHYHGSLPQQHEVVWNLLPTADPGGPSTISL